MTNTNYVSQLTSNKEMSRLFAVTFYRVSSVVRADDHIFDSGTKNDVVALDDGVEGIHNKSLSH